MKNILKKLKNSYCFKILVFSILLISASIMFRNIKYVDIENSSKIDVITTLNNNQGYHPKVVSFNEGWNGYKYWMAFTPYPKKDSTKENPVINVSNDMINWSEPQGISNPLDIPTKTDEKHYNSDTHLLYNEKLNQLELFWRYVDDELNNVVIYKMTSKDGTNWSKKEVFLKSKNRSAKDYVSPTIIYEDEIYKIWYVDKKNIYYIEKNGNNITTPTLIKLKYANGYYTWHIDIIHNKDKNIYELVTCACENLNDREKMSLYYSYSTDNVKWETPITITSPSTSPQKWDSGGLYRSSILYENNNYYIFYSAYDIKHNVGIGIMYGEDIKKLKAYI